jgi:hypothetical protein
MSLCIAERIIPYHTRSHTLARNQSCEHDSDVGSYCTGTGEDDQGFDYMEVEEQSCQDELAAQHFMSEIISNSAAGSYLPLLADLGVDPRMDTSIQVCLNLLIAGPDHHDHQPTGYHPSTWLELTIAVTMIIITITRFQSGD